MPKSPGTKPEPPHRHDLAKLRALARLATEDGALPLKGEIAAALGLTLNGTEAWLRRMVKAGYLTYAPAFWRLTESGRLQGGDQA